MGHGGERVDLRALGWSAIPVAIACGVLGAANVLDRWSLLGVPSLGDSFGDLRQITATSECLLDRPGWSFESPTCDPFGRPYNYPAVIARLAALLGVRQNDTELIGWVLIGLLAVTIGVLTYVAVPGTRRPGLVVGAMSLVAVSPPVILGAERGNVDILAFALVVAFVVACLRGRGVAEVVLLASATTLKLFPIGAATGLAVGARRPTAKLAAVGALVATVLLSERGELRRIVARTPQQSDLSFGVSDVPLKVAAHLGAGLSSASARAVGLTLFAAVCVGVVVLACRTSSARVRRTIDHLLAGCASDRTALLLVLVGSGVFLVAYLAGTSYDYRLMFLGIAVAGVARLTADGSAWLLPLITLLVLMFVTYPVGRWQYVADVAWLVVAPCLAVLVVCLLRRGAPPHASAHGVVAGSAAPRP